MQTAQEIKNEEYFFLKLANTIKHTLKFESEKYSDSFLKRRISVRMRATGLNNYSDYEEFFKDSKEEQEQMLKNLTIHVTEFFRDESFWELCKTKFFKEVLKIFEKNKTITIWSAGCSSGQEAVSILITFLEINPNSKNKIKIICTDISEDIIRKAQSFEYDKLFEIRGLKPEIINKYFTDNGETIKLKDEYKQYFKFLKHDILKEEFIKNIDVIFLRNTVIYFSKETKDVLYEKIYDHIDNMGFFILGKTETLTGPARDRFKVYDSKERIFEKS